MVDLRSRLFFLIHFPSFFLRCWSQSELNVIKAACVFSGSQNFFFMPLIMRFHVVCHITYPSLSCLSVCKLQQFLRSEGDHRKCLNLLRSRSTKPKKLKLSERQRQRERERENKFISFYVLSIRLQSLAPTNAY